MFILFAMVLLFSCVKKPVPETAVDVLNSISELKPPLTLVESLFWDVDTTKACTDREFELLDLMKVVSPDWWEHFKYIPVGKLSLRDPYIAVLLYQYYPEEMHGYLVNYTEKGKYVDDIRVFEWNAEGAIAVVSLIDADQEISIKSSNIYVNEGEPDIQVKIINADGHFIPKPE